MCHCWEFPGGLVVRTWRFHCHGSGSIPDQETKTSQALPHSQKDNNKMCHSLKLVIWLHQTPASEVKWSESRSVISDCLQPHGLYSSWNSLGQNTGVGSLSLLQGIFLTQGLNHIAGRFFTSWDLYPRAENCLPSPASKCGCFYKENTMRKALCEETLKKNQKPCPERVPF